MATKSVILLDFDNIFLTLWKLDQQTALKFGNDPMLWMPLLAERHLVEGRRRWLVARCYLNPAGYVPAPDESNGRLYLSRFRPGLVRAGFEVVDCPSVASGGKNAADIRLVIDALDLLDHRSAFEEFVIGSGDSDFVPLLHRIRADARTVTVLSPGVSSSAYLSLADKVLDFSAIDALVRPEEHREPVSEVVRSASAEDHPGKRAFAELVRSRYLEATAALNLSSLAQQASRSLGDVNTAGWFEAGSFGSAVRQLDLPNAQFSQHYLWDEERHEPPVDAKREMEGDTMPEIVATLVRTIDLPKLDCNAWPKLFEVLARYAAEHDFNLTASTRWSRDTLALEGVHVSRAAVGFAIHAIQFGGLSLSRVPSPQANEIAEACLRNLVSRAAANGVVFDEPGKREITAWLGVEDAPASLLDVPG